MTRIAPVTPGELLLEEFLKPLGITKYRLAKEIGVPAQRIGDIVAGKRAITADTDLRLCRFFGLSRGYWLRAQVEHDTEVAERELAETLAAIGSFTGVAIDPARAEEIAQGPVFARDAKTGADFTDKLTRDRAATHSAVVEDEIAKVGEWVGMIAQQVGLTVPVKQTLF